VLDNIQRRARMDNLLNVHPVWADVERVGKTAIPAGSLDVVFLVNILTHAKDRASILTETLRLLKDKARCIVVDWVKAGLSIGPRDGNFVDFDMIKQWARENGFAVQEEFGVGDYHKGLVLFKG
jgi:SAM-dependent methyltransferase